MHMTLLYYYDIIVVTTFQNVIAVSVNNPLYHLWHIDDGYFIQH